MYNFFGLFRRLLRDRLR